MNSNNIPPAPEEEPQLPQGPPRVAVGIITKKEKILLCQRKPGKPFELQWEFPGGKAFEYEAIEQALARELNEELGIAIREIRPVHSEKTSYGTGVHFDVTYFIVDSYAGAVTNYVFHNMAWVPYKDLGNYNILEGNKPVVQKLIDGTIPLHLDEDEDWD